MGKQSMNEAWQRSYLFGANSAYLEALYEQYLLAPEQVDATWRRYFDELGGERISHAEIRDQMRDRLQHPGFMSSSDITGVDERVDRFIAAYRQYGHLLADIDPLQHQKRSPVPQLEPHFYGFTEQDLSQPVAANFPGVTSTTTLQELIQLLKKTYAEHIGFEYTYVNNLEELTFLKDRIETPRVHFPVEEKKKLLDQLIAADVLEKFLGNRYVGQKRFSIEGSDVLIPVLNYLIQWAGALGVTDVIMGMAHRGRLNVLTNVVGKPIQTLLEEFDGKFTEPKPGVEPRSGDVKYHLGFSSDVSTSGGLVHLILAFNPSHLEFVGAVVEGSVRARQDRCLDKPRSAILPVLIHGDAALAGQGIVAEILNLSQTVGFSTGGTLHFVTNNQIGFTTSNPKESRSTLYCTDIAKSIQAPVFHVNGDDPEAVLFATKLAIDYRMKFGKDIFIDLVCYRRHGHQEVDEPTATQPMMYQIIKQHAAPYQIYATQLKQENLITEAEQETLYANQYKLLEEGKTLLTSNRLPKRSSVTDWSSYFGKFDQIAVTAVNKSVLDRLCKKLEALPEGMTLQPQVAKMMVDRKKMASGELAMNWGFAETLAYATLLSEGVAIRLSGQDAERGTFAHRHAVLHDYQNGRQYMPLAALGSDQKAPITVINSVLSELSVLGFEYGYSTSAPKSLVIWEAQFGDFANGAQVIIDQFISSAEQKWGRLCGLVMLLPHGYEGMGPEHSSARLERYLQLCAQENMQVCVPTTPAQIFHLLRRQMLQASRKPLIVMSPKSLLRHPLAVSALTELSQGEFHCVIPEVDALSTKEVTRVVLCSGKVYYDLLAKRRELKISHVALVRIEQLYPFPREALKAILGSYAKAKEVVWCQEEPKNQGAWYQTQHHLSACLSTSQTLHYAGRDHSAAPAVGSHKIHVIEQEKLINEALKGSK